MRYVEQLPEARDQLHMSRIYPSHNRWGIPDLPAVSTADIPDYLVAFKTRLRNGQDPQRYAVHYYMDDYRFASVWSKPHVAAKTLGEHYGASLTPDFSIYLDMPEIMKIWNVYRNRWVGAFLVENTTITVIPSVSWSASRASWDYCFAGLSSGSVISLAGLGRRPTSDVLSAWQPGFEALIERIAPPLILSYGDMPDWLLARYPVRCYATRWQTIRAEANVRRKLKKGQS